MLTIMAAFFSLFFLISLPSFVFSPPFLLMLLKKKTTTTRRCCEQRHFFFFWPYLCLFFFPLEIRNRFRCLCVPFLRFLSPPPHLSCCCFSELIRTHSNAAFVLPATNVSPLSFLNLFFFKEVFLPSLFVTIAHIHSERKLRLPCCCAAFSFLPTYLLFSLFPLCLLFFFFLFNRNSIDRVLHHSGHWISANTEDFNLHEAFIIIIIIIFCCCCLALLLLYFEERKKKGKTKRYLFFFFAGIPVLIIIFYLFIYYFFFSLRSYFCFFFFISPPPPYVFFLPSSRACIVPFSVNADLGRTFLFKVTNDTG